MTLREQLQPLIKAFGAGDTEHAGLEVQATLIYFCRTGHVRLEWRDRGERMAMLEQDDDTCTNTPRRTEP